MVALRHLGFFPEYPVKKLFYDEHDILKKESDSQRCGCDYLHEITSTSRIYI
jgi:hypothetical protein